MRPPTPAIAPATRAGLAASVALLVTLLFPGHASAEPAAPTGPPPPPRPPTQAEAQANRAYATAQRLFLAGKFSEAVPQLESTVKVNDRFLPAYYMLGIAYYQVGDYARSEKAFVETTRIDARYAMGYVQAAGSALAQGHYDDARRHAQAIHHFDQRSFLGHYALGVCAYTEGKLHEAIGHFERCRMAYGEYSPGLYNLAVALYNERGAQRALGWLRQACLAEPKKGLYHFAQGWYFFMTRDTMSGYNAFRRLMERDQSPLVSVAKGLMAYQVRGYADALKEADAAIGRQPDLVKAWVLKGLILAAQGNRGGARDAYLEALALDPCDLDARDGLVAIGQTPPPMGPARLPRAHGDVKSSHAPKAADEGKAEGGGKSAKDASSKGSKGSASPAPTASPTGTPANTPTAAPSAQPQVPSGVTPSPAPTTAEQVKARARALPPAPSNLPPGIPFPGKR